ncbi:hypothetical protein D187_009231 [Cystobacter fuscus DSM 2262]|uniref:Uncharacterized protein n=1 Tax=Cystobacter fuscus (strain ATCC 25194 / DSM 2262 / NBRC 100088 / M29) TaxID=1242864 RepID=S9NU08_CYSF2|nr:hypothetical protein D187_009231 [Cystobacter fuscus DSM 2262]
MAQTPAAHLMRARPGRTMPERFYKEDPPAGLAGVLLPPSFGGLPEASQ